VLKTRIRGGVHPNPAGSLGERGAVFITRLMKRISSPAWHSSLPVPGKTPSPPGTAQRSICFDPENFYHPQFHGSFSLKDVLPALVPSMKYETLAIREGA